MNPLMLFWLWEEFLLNTSKMYRNNDEEKSF
jgi:hypothetical protein